MVWELRVNGCGGHLCNVTLGDEATLAELHAAVEAETGVRPKDLGLFHGLDELLFDSDVAAVFAAEAVDILLVHSPDLRVKSLVGRLCADSLARVEEQVARIELRSAQELHNVCRIVYEKAMTEPHCSEVCADLLSELRRQYPEFPAEEAGGRRKTFTYTFLCMLQDEFEECFELRGSPLAEGASAGPEDLRGTEKIRRRKATIEFIGRLFLRQLVVVKVIGQVVYELIGMGRYAPPSSQDVECVLALLQVVGAELNKHEHGTKLMLAFTGRLREVARTTVVDGQSGSSVGLKQQIQDLIVLQQSGLR